MHGIHDPHGFLADEIAEQMLPELLIDGSNLTRTAKKLGAMFAQHRRFLFNGHEPIQVVHENDGMPRAVTVTPETVRVFAHEICTPIRTVKDNKEVRAVRTTLSKDIANLYLHGLVGQWRRKPFNGITTAPILARDGSFRTGSGYDEATGLWCHQIPAVNVPKHPTLGPSGRGVVAGSGGTTGPPDPLPRQSRGWRQQ
jgi:hypothetical protein